VTEHQADTGQAPIIKEERLYLGGFEVFRRYSGEGSAITLERETLHLMDDHQRIALVETKTVHAESPTVDFQPLTRFQLGNHLGSASLELDGEGRIISYEEYFPYGSTSYQAVRGDIEVPPKRYRYTGMEHDEESGFSYHGTRYCAPWLGRWLSCDPTGIAGGINIYGYAAGNPIALVDASGESPRSYSGGTTEIAEAGTSGLTQEEGGFWTYTDESGKFWNLVDVYETQKEAQYVEIPGEIEGDLKFDPWAFWLFEREDPRRVCVRVPVTQSREVLQDRVWFEDPGEIIEIHDTAPKEEERGALSTLFHYGKEAAGIALDLYSPAGWEARAAKYGAQFILGLIEGDSAATSAKNVGKGALFDTAVDLGSKALKKVAKGTKVSTSGAFLKDLGGTTPIPRGTHFALGRHEILEEFASKQGAVSIRGAYDRRFFQAAADPQIFTHQFGGLVDTFMQNGGRIKFNLSGMVGGLDTVTSWELSEILKNPAWRRMTDFYDQGKKLTGPALTRRLAPWR
jgi:RHS repeat-associated protein